MSYHSDINEQLNSQRALLKSYRAVSSYTIKAVEKAIEEIECSINKGEFVEVMTQRKKELEHYLDEIIGDRG